MSGDPTPPPKPPETVTRRAGSPRAETVDLRSRGKARPPAGERALVEFCESVRVATVSRLDAGEGAPGKFRFERTLGEGGMGRVLLVTDRDIRRTVALKTILPQHREDATLLAAFLDEVQIAGQLQHPNILPIYDMGAAGDELFFTMKHVEGDTLRAVLERLGAGDAATREEYTVVRRLQLFQQVCHGMAYAHEKGVVHRDLKPSNIMIGAFGEVLIMDWGLAMVVGEPPAEERAGPSAAQPDRRRVTTSRYAQGTSPSGHSVVGTPAYMSPEQIKGDLSALDARSDVYALGTILFELLTVQLPYHAKTTVGVMREIMRTDPEAPSVVAGRRGLHVSPTLDAICLKALAKAPEDRHQSALDLAAEVQGFIDGSRERERRAREAAEHIARGSELSERYHAAVAEIAAGAAEVDALEAEVPAHAPLAEKSALWAARERLEELRRGREQTYEAAHDAFDAALGVDPRSPGARAGKADLFWDYFRAAEEAGDAHAARHFRARVEAFHDGKYARALDAPGRLRLQLEPWPARLGLVRFREQPLLIEVERRELGDERELALEPGHYLLEAEDPGHAPLRVPLDLRRDVRCELRRGLVPVSAVPKGFLLIAGGEAVLGGDDEAPSSLPRTRQAMPDLLLARDPLSAGEYLEFVNALAGRDPQEALSRVPRARANTPPLWTPDGEGHYALAAQRFQEQPWDARWPIFGVSYRDATEYCRWRSERDGRRFRLPSEEEWEWAARGPGGLRYPWGQRFDPTFCKMKDSRAGAPRPEPIGAFASDRSLTGVRDLAGGVHEWCASKLDDERGMAVLRGGSFISSAPRCRAAARSGDQPYDRHLSYGFRLALDPA